ncbi:FAD dependent oxidoreductase [Penicillium maclennaniae]|uniref:FAD dependent oxidoreductase n=1 Tax=Penicillium maclennaniae TaxID=1343394 RepID=UPI00253FFE22|nr:FAD dependent oxidoreductase [Penicillium maclennaniae]KAJ5684477.1 FAD dependent oxidoreductase [Penicillium maclennaniae]
MNNFNGVLILLEQVSALHSVPRGCPVVQIHLAASVLTFKDINDGSNFLKAEAALTTFADAAHSEHEIVFLVPRNDNILLIGGIAKSHEWNLSLTLDSPILKRMRARYEFFLPGLSLRP